MRDAVSLFLPTHLTIAECLSAVKYAEARGFEAVWQAESTYVRDPLVTMGLYAGVTQRIRLGVGVIHHPLRSLPALSAALVTLDDIAPKRVLCALGPWNDTEAARAGIVRQKPLLAMRETITALRQLLALEKVTLAGETRQLSNVQLQPLERFEPRQVGLLVGSSGPFHALAGDTGDGVLLNSMVTPAYTAHAVAEARIGLDKARREVSSFVVAQLILCSVAASSSHYEDALQQARRAVLLAILHQPDWMRANGVPQGLVDELQQMARTLSHDMLLATATALIPEGVVRQLVAVGNEREVRAKVREYMDAGATMPIVVPLGSDVRALIDVFAHGYTESDVPIFGRERL